MKKLLTLLMIITCLSASAQTAIVYDTSVVRAPLTVAAHNVTRYDTLYMPAATSVINGYATATALSDITNLQSSMTSVNSSIGTLQTQVAALNNALLTNTQTATTYTLVVGDNNRVVRMTNASLSTMTIPAGLPDGWTCYAVQGGQTITFTPAAGVTVISPLSYKRSQTVNGLVTIRSLGNNLITLSGNLKN